MAVALPAAIFMALVAPYGTGAVPLIERLGFWIIGVGAGAFAALALGGRLSRIAWLRGRPMAVGLAATALLTPLLALAASLAAALLHHHPIDWTLCALTVPQIALAGVGVTALTRLALRPDASTAVAPVADDPNLGGLIPLQLTGAELIALEAQDHYVRVHTCRGSALALMPFQSALDKVSGMNGQRTHRSWWVARSGLRDVDRGDGRAVLTLKNGLKVPVSRRYARNLRGAGWY